MILPAGTTQIHGAPADYVDNSTNATAGQPITGATSQNVQTPILLIQGGVAVRTLTLSATVAAGASFAVGNFCEYGAGAYGIDFTVSGAAATYVIRAGGTAGALLSVGEIQIPSSSSTYQGVNTVSNSDKAGYTITGGTVSLVSGGVMGTISVSTLTLGVANITGGINLTNGFVADAVVIGSGGWQVKGPLTLPTVNITNGLNFTDGCTGDAVLIGGDVEFGGDLAVDGDVFATNAILGGGTLTANAGSVTIGGNVPPVNLIKILGTLLTETAGQIAAGFKKFFNIASPTLTTAGVDQTGDSYARIGAGGSGLTSIGDIRLAYLNAPIESVLLTAIDADNNAILAAAQATLAASNTSATGAIQTAQVLIATGWTVVNSKIVWTTAALANGPSGGGGGGGFAFNGARAVTFYMQDTASASLQATAVRIAEGADAELHQQQTATNFTTSLDDLTYLVSATKDGYEFTPETVTVGAGNTSFTLTFTQVSMPISGTGNYFFGQ